VRAAIPRPPRCWPWQGGRLEAENREIDEALRAATDAVQALWVATERLGSAGYWSTYETWLGGGVIGSMVKHDRDALDARREALLTEA
jgi:hypothetical protein